MSPASVSLENQLLISLRLPDQTATVTVDVTARWGYCYAFGLEFSECAAGLRNSLFRAPSSQAEA